MINGSKEHREFVVICQNRKGLTIAFILQLDGQREL
jgi:hypothetical protein